jgi:hypothetical protein
MPEARVIAGGPENGLLQPPVDVTACSYGTPTVAGGNEEVVIIKVGEPTVCGVTTRVNVCVADTFAVSVTVTGNV